MTHRAGGCSSATFAACMGLAGAAAAGGSGAGTADFLRSMLSAMRGGIAATRAGALSVLISQKTLPKSALASTDVAAR
jgi:hypothetical protein